MLKDYLQQWLNLKRKKYTPLLWFSFVLQLLNITLFAVYDTLFLWIEDSLTFEENNVCNLSNYTSRIQDQFIFGSVCSVTVVYSFVVPLLTFNTSTMILTGKEVFYIYKNFSYTLRTPLGKRKHLAHVRFYKVVDTLMQITIITNIIIRLLRYQLDYHIPNYWDNITYYLVMM